MVYTAWYSAAQLECMSMQTARYIQWGIILKPVDRMYKHAVYDVYSNTW